MKLIGTLTSPYVRKVRVVMAEKKLDYQFVLDDPWRGESQITQFNPLGKVPCLVMEGGEAVFDSRVIVEHLDVLSPVGKLIPPSGRERIEVRTWEALADGVCEAGILARLEEHWAPRAEGERSGAWIDYQLAKVDAGIDAMGRGLGERNWCAGGLHLSLADVAVGCALDWLSFRLPQLDWRGRHPNLAKLVERLMQRPSFADTLPRLA
ncbi:MAG TPA: glutathione S-transferase N-terminal domain-containing protein [Methylibium sp.]|uniref:glutathione S-transferase N-terminal domain-containing protein n=1 Tax=Methylibium sp. TaxID=2067992 RepID=UPI002DBEDD40|nr:glutathione S-transferase N-terminal domain-containing protein [Methylibium sp.]HEU4460461.1 glutathione S-transferase N-terminal domain-containing protein [Methylibium sp.]